MNIHSTRIRTAIIIFCILMTGIIVHQRTVSKFTQQMTLKEMAQANRLDQDFEAKVRDRVEKEAQAKMEKAVATVTNDPQSAALSQQEAFERIMAVYRGEA